MSAIPAGYKLTEVGVIPGDWGCKPLQELTDPARPIGYGIVQTGKSVLNGVRCIRVVDMVGKIDPDQLITTSQEISQAYKRTLLHEGDLVIALRGKIGAVAVIRKELTGANLTRGVALLSASKYIHCDYLSQYLSSSVGKSTIEKNLNGSALQEIPIASLRRIPTIVPPLPEQRAIAAALSDVDALLAKLDQLIAKKRDLKQAAMQQLLTGETRLPGFSGEWETAPLRYYFRDFIVPMRDKPKNLSGHIPWCRIEDFSGKYLFDSKSDQYVDDQTVQEMNLKVFPVGTLLVSCSADLGRCAIVGRPLVSNQTFIGMVPHESRASNDFFYYYVTSKAEDLNNLSSGTTISYLSREQFETFSVHVPKQKEEQTAIATALSDMDAELAALEARRDKTRALKQGMMQELLTGRIRLV